MHVYSIASSVYYPFLKTVSVNCEVPTIQLYAYELLYGIVKWKGRKKRKKKPEKRRNVFNSRPYIAPYTQTRIAPRNSTERGGWRDFLSKPSLFRGSVLFACRGFYYHFLKYLGVALDSHFGNRFLHYMSQLPRHRLAPANFFRLFDSSPAKA